MALGVTMPTGSIVQPDRIIWNRPIMKKSISVPAAQRYTAAWAEINSRLLSRQSANIGFATITLTAASLILGAMLEQTRVTMLPILAGALMMLTWSFALWIRHNDATIGLLGAFCKALELRDEAAGDDHLPAWHMDSQDWIVEARSYRKYSDIATSLIAAIAALPSGFLARSHFASTEYIVALLMLVTFVLALLASLFTMRTAVVRKRIASSSFREVNGLFVFARPDVPRELKQRA